MTGTDLCVNKPHCAAAVRPWESEATTSTLPPARVRTCLGVARVMSNYGFKKKNQSRSYLNHLVCCYTVACCIAYALRSPTCRNRCWSGCYCYLYFWLTKLKSESFFSIYLCIGSIISDGKTVLFITTMDWKYFHRNESPFMIGVNTNTSFTTMNLWMYIYNNASLLDTSDALYTIHQKTTNTSDDEFLT